MECYRKLFTSTETITMRRRKTVENSQGEIESIVPKKNKLRGKKKGEKAAVRCNF